MEWSRREVLGSIVASMGAAAAGAVTPAAEARVAAQTRPADEPFGYCLNTSTIRGNQLDIVRWSTPRRRRAFTPSSPG
jgi:hypothetical protein